jgi:hypothetical protein
MEIKILHIFGTFSKSNRKIVETETKSISLTHKYMIAHFPGLEFKSEEYEV